MSENEVKVRIEDEALAYFERDLLSLEDRVSKGALKAFGTSEHQLLREIDVLLQNAATIAETCIAIEMDHPTAVVEEDKDFRSMRVNQFEEIKKRFQTKEEKIANLQSSLKKLHKNVTELHTWTRQPVE